jgi:mono/diheme cytochrome c family protein
LRSASSAQDAGNVTGGEVEMKVNAGKWFALAGATAVIAVIAAAMSLVVIQPASATAQFSTDTGKSCGDCHTNAKGGGPLTPFGEKFKANGNKLPK